MYVRTHYDQVDDSTTLTTDTCVRMHAHVTGGSGTGT